jgi:hypothetical protein
VSGLVDLIRHPPIDTRPNGVLRSGRRIDPQAHPTAYRVLVDPNDWTSGFISRADVADFLVTSSSRSMTIAFSTERPLTG